MARQTVEPEPEWDRLLSLLLGRRRLQRVYVVGAPDTGKSTLITYLYENLRQQDDTALIDADPGQSRIGPPMTLGLTWNRSLDLSARGAGAVVFGNTFETPALGDWTSKSWDCMADVPRFGMAKLGKTGSSVYAIRQALRKFWALLKRLTGNQDS